MFLAAIGLILLLGIPIIMLIWGGIKLLFGIRKSTFWIGIPALVLWIAGVILCGMVAYHLAKDFNYRVTTSQENTLQFADQETIYLKLDQESEDDYYYVNDDYILGDWEGLILNEYNEVLITYPELQIRKSADSSIRLITKSTARGKTRSHARQRTYKTMYDFQVKDSALIFSPWFRLPEKEKWRKQEIRLILEIPVGRKIYCEREISGIIDYDDNGMPYNLTGKTWIMTEDGLKQFETKQ